MQKIAIGSVEIISLTDTELAIPLHVAFPDIRAEQWLAYDHTALTPSLTGEEFLHMRVGVFLVRSPEYVFLVDTGLGLVATTTMPSPAPALPPSGLAQYFSGVPVRLQEELLSVGIKPEDVDTVFLTHAHRDHYGWNLTNEGNPFFPNARYMLSRTDWEAFQHPAMPAPLRWGLEHFVSPLSGRGMLDLVPDKHQLFPEIRMLPTPGHTPGHMSLLIDAGGQQVLIGGDAFVHPLQISDVTVSFTSDMDRVQMTKTRKHLREWLCQDRIILAANHLPGSGIGRILHDAHQYFWQEEESRS
jgi:glyoxylase-like metal-dependent hydrolase (beta-lactamase superfamily II)